MFLKYFNIGVKIYIDIGNYLNECKKKEIDDCRLEVILQLVESDLKQHQK